MQHHNTLAHLINSVVEKRICEEMLLRSEDVNSSVYSLSLACFPPRICKTIKQTRFNQEKDGIFTLSS